MTAIVSLVVVIGVAVVMLHAMWCPGWRWSGVHAAELSLLLRRLGDPSLAEDERLGAMKRIGPLVRSADDHGMTGYWIPIFDLGNRDLLAEQIRKLNQRSIWLAHKADRCHLKWLPTCGLAVIRGARSK